LAVPTLDLSRFHVARFRDPTRLDVDDISENWFQELEMPRNGAGAYSCLFGEACVRHWSPLAGLRAREVDHKRRRGGAFRPKVRRTMGGQSGRVEFSEFRKLMSEVNNLPVLRR
jgi:hypothetical protein